MLERNELARAMTELPDDLLLEAERTDFRRRSVKFRRLAAVAAVIALLAVTVCAVSMGISWTVDKESGETVVSRFGGIALEYYKDYDGTQSFEKLEFTVPLEKVELKKESLTDLGTFLNRWWNLTRYTDAAWVRNAPLEWEVVGEFDGGIGKYMTADQKELRFESLEDVEQLLGMELAVPDTVREAIRSETETGLDHVLSLRIHAGVTVAQAQTADALEPVRVVVHYRLNQYCTNGQVTGSITIPLTAEAASAGLHEISYSYEKEGAIWQEEQTIGGRDLMIFGNDPEMGYDGWCDAVYTSDGIGYSISARRDADIPHYSPGWPNYASARDMLLSLLEPEK